MKNICQCDLQRRCECEAWYRSLSFPPPFSALMTKSKSFYPLDGQKKKHKSQTHSAILIDICTIIYSVSRKKKCEWARGRRRGGETKDQKTKNTYKNIKLFNLFR